MESPGELGSSWVWEEEGSGAGCSQEEPQDLSPCVTPFLAAAPSLASVGSEKTKQIPRLVLPPGTAWCSRQVPCWSVWCVALARLGLGELHFWEADLLGLLQLSAVVVQVCHARALLTGPNLNIPRALHPLQRGQVLDPV